MIRFAASQYAIELIEQWDAYAAHLDAHVAEAAAAGAQLVLLPEYAAMALTGQLPPAERSDLAASIAGIQPLLPRWQRKFYMILARNADDASDYFSIPSNRVVEIGTQVAI